MKGGTQLTDGHSGAGGESVWVVSRACWLTRKTPGDALQEAGFVHFIFGNVINWVFRVRVYTSGNFFVIFHLDLVIVLIGFSILNEVLPNQKRKKSDLDMFIIKFH